MFLTETLFEGWGPEAFAEPGVPFPEVLSTIDSYRNHVAGLFGVSCAFQKRTHALE